MRTRFTRAWCIIGLSAGMTAATSVPAATILAQSPNMALLGYFEAGSYRIDVTGVVSLAGPVGSGFDILADGSPETPVAYPNYQYFNPSGADNDMGVFGLAGPGFNLGSLVGSFSQNIVANDLFRIGMSTTFSVAAGSNLYAFVNDTSYANNDGSFSASVTSVSAVPEPASWGLMITGFGLLGVAMRRRQLWTKSVSVTYA